MIEANKWGPNDAVMTLLWRCRAVFVALQTVVVAGCCSTALAIDVTTLRISSWMSAYETPNKAVIRADLQFAGEQGTYTNGTNIGGRLTNLTYDQQFVDAQGNTTGAIHGRWHLDGNVGYCVFREPDDTGLSNGYWGYFTNNGERGRIAGSWDARLVSVAPQLNVAAAQLSPGESGFQTKVEAIQGSNNIMPIEFLVQGVTAAAAIGRLVYSDNFVDPGGIRGRKGDPIGTCFLVAPEFILTALHVIPNNSKSHAQFDVNRCDVVGGPLVSSKDWDYALYKIDTGGANGMPQPLPIKSGVKDGSIQFTADEPVVIVHFPGGNDKRITVFDSRVQDADLCRNVLLYSSDTTPGSSGAPVLNQFWEVIAVHRGPIEYARKNERARGNYGSRIDRIIEDMRRQLPTTQGGAEAMQQLGIQ